MNEATTLCSPLSLCPAKQKIPEKAQCLHLIMHLSKKQLKIFKGFSFIVGHNHIHKAPYSFYVSFSQKRPQEKKFIFFLTFASIFKSTCILQHESSCYVLHYIKLPKSRVKLQSAKFQTTSSDKHSSGSVQKLLLSTKWGPAHRSLAGSIPSQPAGTTWRNQHFYKNFKHISFQILNRKDLKHLSWLLISIPI